jgi:AcrR family transcriptional regulator
MGQGCATCRSLRAAAVAMAVRGGIRSVTWDAVVREAGVEPGRATLHYPTLENCFAAAFDEWTAHFRSVTEHALDREGTWQERMRASAVAAMEELDRSPDLARFCVLEVWRSDLPMLRAARLEARRRYVDLMLRFHAASGEEPLPDVHMEVLVGAGHHVTSEGLDRDDGFAVLDGLDRLIGVFDPARV